MKKLLICALLSISLIIAAPDKSRADHCGFWDVTGHCSDATALYTIVGLALVVVAIGYVSSRSRQYYFSELDESSLYFSLSPTFEPDTKTTGLNFGIKY